MTKKVLIRNTYPPTTSPVTCFQHPSESSRTKNIAHRARLQVSQNKKAKNYKWYLRENMKTEK